MFLQTTQTCINGRGMIGGNTIGSPNLVNHSRLFTFLWPFFILFSCDFLINSIVIIIFLTTNIFTFRHVLLDVLIRHNILRFFSRLNKNRLIVYLFFWTISLLRRYSNIFVNISPFLTPTLMDSNMTLVLELKSLKEVWVVKLVLTTLGFHYFLVLILI